MNASPSQTRKAALVSLCALLASSSVHATVWWPEVAPVVANLNIYRDYQDSSLFYYVPKAVGVATNQAGVRMLSHEIFFNRLNPARSATQYHMTFEPLLGGSEVEAARLALAARYGGGARLVPLPVTRMSFEVTQKIDSGIEARHQISSPFSVFVPEWSGDLHSLHQRFSVVMIGNAYMAEPAMSRFLMNPAGNAFVGTLHYGFRGVQRVFEGHALVNVSQFVSRIKTHLSVSGFWTAIDVGAAIEKIKDDRSVFVEVVKDQGYESEAWRSLTSKLVDLAFEPLPQPPQAPAGSDAGFAFLRFRASFESVSVDRKVRIDLKEAVVKEHAGDIDIAAGAVPADLLSPNLRYLCDMWAIYDARSERCEAVCEPGLEYYNPTTRSCAPAFGAGV